MNRHSILIGAIFLWLASFAGLRPATADGMAGRIIGHADVAGATNLSTDVIAKLATLRWFFTHASVGGNLVTGMNVLHTNDPARYPLTIYNYNGQNSASDYHGAVATEGTEGAEDYRASDSPAATTNGIIYECMRGNPGWENKLTCFSNSVIQSGWRFPKVNVAMDKFCWIDPYADPTQYCATMNDLEGRYPQTLFVYTTLPLTTETAGSENDNRNDFNRAVRSFCATNGKWLLDMADLEAWTTNGVQQTYVSSGVTNQKMCGAYAMDPGGDFHLTLAGRRQTALGWYALAGALFATDRDQDGMSDGDELLAGTSPAQAESVLSLLSCDIGATNAVDLQWNMVTGRVYAIEKCTTSITSSWGAAIGGLTGTGLYTYATSSVPAETAYFRIGATQ